MIVVYNTLWNWIRMVYWKKELEERKKELGLMSQAKVMLHEEKMRQAKEANE